MIQPYRPFFTPQITLVEGEGFEPSKAEPSDLQSDPFDRSGIPPEELCIMEKQERVVKAFFEIYSSFRTPRLS